MLCCAALPLRRYPSGESYMDVIQRLEPVVTGGAWAWLRLPRLSDSLAMPAGHPFLSESLAWAPCKLARSAGVVRHLLPARQPRCLGICTACSSRVLRNTPSRPLLGAPTPAEVEREKECVCIVSHQAVLRALYGYFMNVDLEVSQGGVGWRVGPVSLNSDSEGTWQSGSWVVGALMRVESDFGDGRRGTQQRSH